MLSRPVLGLLVGTALGALDGLSALVSSPEVSGQIAGIVVGSTIKGLLCGVIVGAIARKLRSSRAGVAIGVVVASVVTFPIAYMNATHYGRPDYYWKIMLPGALVGAIVGYVVMRHGKVPLASSRLPQ
jgi:threonine/homoserine efflux transporter RhtA